MVDGDYKYTQMGRAYFEARGEHAEYIVHIPVKITGRNTKTGRRYERLGHLPPQLLILGQCISLWEGRRKP